MYLPFARWLYAGSFFAYNGGPGAAYTYSNPAPISQSVQGTEAHACYKVSFASRAVGTTSLAMTFGDIDTGSIQLPATYQVYTYYGRAATNDDTIAFTGYA